MACGQEISVNGRTIRQGRRQDPWQQIQNHLGFTTKELSDYQCQLSSTRQPPLWYSHMTDIWFSNGAITLIRPSGSSTDLHSFKRKVFSKMLGRLFIKNQDSLGYVEASRQSNLLEWPEARGYSKIESMTGQTLVDLDRVLTLYHKPAKANLIRPDVSYSMPQDIRATQASLQQMAAEYSPTVRRHCR